ncbi:MAG TPA: 30S ribosomal protein S6 [Termitinemataceae bacterium]|jgi:small subunit ribosomal protein S6|uniref:30S ribosomal protein S6 n=1 Tax=Treponema sp. J25 TaxID=2094121 RepID=UPI00104F31DB|nr:30S ribosomal protein S6 [Treponema sp. J25]TCW60772.1 30S ribosomal protein S6 [Treponema sp. J25]HOJ98149.1 30S ribosomal protein S6 [Termitinemataceae bacterium]HOM22441.1 30S ribosomal protein S6 [Termitinemataceae bacterium]HPP99559.1 30S ribosomal protein S6 [Termitinemataceae bacterium]
MRHYELTVIFPLEEDQYRSGREQVMADLAAHHATVEKTDEMGDRDLAYPINKRKRGRYVVFYLQLDPAQLTGLDRAFKLNQNVVRYLFVKVD